MSDSCQAPGALPCSRGLTMSSFGHPSTRAPRACGGGGSRRGGSSHTGARSVRARGTCPRSLARTARTRVPASALAPQGPASSGRDAPAPSGEREVSARTRLGEGADGRRRRDVIHEWRWACGVPPSLSHRSPQMRNIPGERDGPNGPSRRRPLRISHQERHTHAPQQPNAEPSARPPHPPHRRRRRRGHRDRGAARDSNSGSANAGQPTAAQKCGRRPCPPTPCPRPRHPSHAALRRPLARGHHARFGRHSPAASADGYRRLGDGPGWKRVVRTDLARARRGREEKRKR